MFTVWHLAMFGIAWLSGCYASVDWHEMAAWKRAAWGAWILLWTAPPLAVIWIRGVMG